MKAMRLISFQLTTCFLYVVIQGLNAQSSSESTPIEDGTTFLLGSLFGFRPCLDQTCSNAQIQDSEYYQSPLGQEYEPQYHETPSNAEATLQYCLPLHTSTIRNIKLVGMRHPEFNNLQSAIIDGLMSYISEISVLDGENCDPASKFLDYILLAAEKFKEDYVKEGGKVCNYTKIIDNESHSKEGNKSDASLTTSASTEAPASTSPASTSTEPSTSVPCTKSQDLGVSTPKSEDLKTPCPDKTEDVKDIVAEDDVRDYEAPVLVGSIRGIPGVHFPNYTDVPITSFSCAERKHIPGFYADLETGCQVFHVCYEHRRESFLCPVGTVFNQPILACDYWYSSNCSLAPVYYDVNVKAEEETSEEAIDVVVKELVNVFMEGQEKMEESDQKKHTSQAELDIMKFLPVKAKITEFKKPVVIEEETVSTAKPETQEVEEVASQIFDNILSTATKVVSKTRDSVAKIPEPSYSKVKIDPVLLVKSKLVVPAAKLATMKSALPLVAKAKLATVKTAIPVAAATAAKVAAVKTAVPIAATAAKVAAVKTAVPIAVKTKLATSVPVAAATKVAAAVPKAVVKASIPVLKTKVVASALPLAKSKVVAPALKGKALKAASLPLKGKMTLPLVKAPLVKAKLAGSAPLAKVKLAKAAAISPVTKKALALGYMKLLKAKKLALLG